MIFSSKVNAIIEAEIQKMEESKRQYREAGRKASVLCYPLAIIGAVLTFFFSLGGFFYIIALLIFAIPFIIKNANKSKLAGQFKQNLLVPALAELKPDISYMPAMSIPQESFDSANLFPGPDRYRGEDLFEGLHGKTKFSFSEIHAEKKHKTKNNTRYSDIFKGLFLVADFNKHLKNETYVFTSGGATPRK